MPNLNICYKEIATVKNNDYVNKFFSLNCSQDILNVLTPINRAEKEISEKEISVNEISEKEISESCAILRKIKPLTMREKNKYCIYDWAAGNALTSVMAAFILPIIKSIAVDIKGRDRNWEEIKKFSYLDGDIYDSRDENLLKDFPPSIFISSHGYPVQRGG